MQLLLLGGLFQADWDLCRLRLASPDLPAQLESMAILIRTLAPHAGHLLSRFQEHRCVIVLSFLQVSAIVLSFLQVSVIVLSFLQVSVLTASGVNAGDRFETLVHATCERWLVCCVQA